MHYYFRLKQGPKCLTLQNEKTPPIKTIIPSNPRSPKTHLKLNLAKIEVGSQIIEIGKEQLNREEKEIRNSCA